MPHIPYTFEDLDLELPHQDPRPGKPVIPKRAEKLKKDTAPSLLPKVSMRNIISLSYTPQGTAAGQARDS